MTTIRENIREYQHSCTTLQQRIDELTGLITGETTRSGGESIKSLESRRYQLYCELTEMQGHIRFLQEYLDCVEMLPQAANE